MPLVTKWRLVGFAVLLLIVINTFRQTQNTSLPMWNKTYPPGLKPHARYSFGASLLESQLIVTHGYYFDHAGMAPHYLADTWIFDLRTSTWSELIIRDQAKIQTPSPRYGNTLTCVSLQLCMLIGGDDGGLSLSGGSYIFGSFFSDVWILTRRQEHGRWTKQSLHATNTPIMQTAQPQKPSNALSQRIADDPHFPCIAEHTATLIGDAVYVFGGLVSYPIAGRKSRAVAATNAVYRFTISSPDNPDDVSPSSVSFSVFSRHRDSPDAPRPRYAHVATAWKNRYVVIYGGVTSGKKQTHLNDVWAFDTQTGKWEMFFSDRPSTPINAENKDPAPNEQSWRLLPQPRQFGASALVDESSWYVYGGCECLPSCKCFGSLWIFDLDARNWKVLPLQKTVLDPPARFRHYVGAWQRVNKTTLVMFGGESYQPYQYHNDVWLLDAVQPHDQWTQFPSDIFALLLAAQVACLLAIMVLVAFLSKRRWSSIRNYIDMEAGPKEKV